MPTLLHCGSCSIELCGASLLDNPPSSRRSPLPHKFLSPYTWHCVPILNGFRYSNMETHGPSLATPILSMKNESVGTREGTCEVIWTIKADLAESQYLYITGEPSFLGCWEPEMAILMSPTEEANLWKAEVKIAPGQNFKYNYFIKGETESLCDIIWRPGPVYSLTVPLLLDQCKKVMVRDSWIRYYSPSMATHQAWGSLIEESYLPMQPAFSAPATDGTEIVSSFHRNSLDPDPFIDSLKVKEKLDLSKTDIHIGIRSRSELSHISDRDQPQEEPWLPYSNVFPVREDRIDPHSSESKEALQDEVMPDFHGSLLPAERSDVSSSASEGSVSTTILINSSICTMQRVAVLEDGKLVELLLEPVKSIVQCDSIYLGVVTKLVPHMGGAFVNIGNSRPSLMDIKQNREPFIFPPFCSGRKKTVRNSSVAGTQNGTADVEKCENTTPGGIGASYDGGEVDTQDNDVQLLHKVETDLKISEFANENLNGSVVDYGEEDAEFEYSVDSSAPEKSDAQNGDSGNQISRESMWPVVRRGTKIIVQVVKEGLGTKGPTLTPYPKLRSRFWILLTNCGRTGVSKKISGVERTRLKVIANTLQPPGFGVTVRTVAAGHSYEELQKDLEGLLTTWKNIVENAKSAALAADEGVKGAAPVILHRAMGQTLLVVQDYFNQKVKKMVVDSPRTYHEVTNHLQDMAPDLCDRVELHDKKIPLFDQYKIEEEIDSILNKRVPLPNGGSLVIEQTEALVSIDVNGGHGMLGQGATQEKAILDVNLAAAKQIARELRLRDIGGIIVVDFIDMADESNKRLVYEEVKKAVERDRSGIKVSELSRHGLMEITRKRVRPSVTFMISEPCTCCNATGRVEALETSFSKIEQEICRSLATMSQRADPGNPKTWPRFILRVDHHMCEYLTSGKRTRLAILSSSLKVWIILKVARGFSRGAFELKPFANDKLTKNQHHVAVSMLRNAEAKTKSSGKSVTVFPVKKL